MKRIFLVLGIFLLIVSCKSYEIAYDSRKKTNQMRSEELRSEYGPFAIQIAFDKSLQNEHVKVEGFGFHYTADLITIFDGKLDDCNEYSCKVLYVNASIGFRIFINGKKIELENTKEHPLTAFKYMFVSKEGAKYKLYFSNYQKAVW